MKDGFIYLASPYSHPAPMQRRARYLAVRDVMSLLFKSGVPVFSPIVHMHEAYVAGLLHEGASEAYREWNRTCMRGAACLVVLGLEGWGSSRGIADELRFAEEFDIPSCFISTRETPEQWQKIINEAIQNHVPASAGT